jgi:general secretion pathway protein J
MGRRVFTPVKFGQSHRKKGVLNSRSRGFTLLELLISMTIVAMIVVIMFGAFRIGIRAWEKGEKDVDIRQRQRIVLDLVKRQLASISMADVRNPDQQPILFKGDSKSVEFVSYIPLTPGSRRGLVYVKYAVSHETGDDRERLSFYERGVASPVKKTGAGETGPGEPDAADFLELLSGMKSIVFEYLKTRPEEKESPWQESWDPAVEKDTPRAIRITLQENDKKAPLYVIAAAGA